jgi:hypothetical protein
LGAALTQAGAIKSAGEAVAGSGRVLATLDDVRAIYFILVIALLFFGALIIYLIRTNRADRIEMRKEREIWMGMGDKFGTAAETLATQTNKVVTELEVQRALSARVESTLGRCERLINAAGNS